MAEREVNSPVNSRNTTSKLSGNIPGFSPGAKSDPSRGDQAAVGRVPERVVQEAGEPAELKTTEPVRGDSVPSGQSMLDYFLQRSLGAAQIKITKPGD
jgi:hypothetical protein